MKSLLKHIATLGPIGYIPFAPGTFGSLAGLICILIFPLSLREHLLFIITGTIIGTFASTSAEKRLNEKDSGKIIIDEFIGFYVAAFLVPRSIFFLIAAFLLFRFIDIFKPLMIRNIEKTLKNGAGVMADDIAAGIYANAVLQLFILIFRNA